MRHRLEAAEPLSAGIPRIACEQAAAALAALERVGDEPEEATVNGSQCHWWGSCTNLIMGEPVRLQKGSLLSRNGLRKRTYRFGGRAVCRRIWTYKVHCARSSE
jgi:hypothetical protein